MGLGKKDPRRARGCWVGTARVPEDPGTGEGQPGCGGSWDGEVAATDQWGDTAMGTDEGWAAKAGGGLVTGGKEAEDVSGRVLEGTFRQVLK